MNMSPIRNQKGLTLVELMVVLFLMTLMTVVIAELTLATVKSMIGSADFGIAMSDGKSALGTMVNELRKAGQPINGGTPAILASSGANQVCVTTYGQNLDALVPGTTDISDDVVCFYWVTPSGTDPSQNPPSYVPGAIMTSHGSGGGTPPDTLKQRLTSPRTDIVSLSFEYCRPIGSVPGGYDCNAVVSGGDIISDSSCVFEIRISMEIARSPNSSNTFPPPTTKLTASVQPRNILYKALHQNDDDDKVIDCCDPENARDPSGVVGNAATWCPPPQD